MISLTCVATCDFCGRTMGSDSQMVEAGDTPLIATSFPVIFGRHACGDCCDKARAAIDAAMPRQGLPSLVRRVN